jgi:uridine kinase
MTARAQLIAEVAALIPAPAGSPVRVAIDGMTGVGKTSFRSELADALRAMGRKVTEASGDDFHHQRARRYAQGRRSTRGYFEDAYDYTALGEKLLSPLGPGGSRVVRLRHHDLETDEILHAEPTVVVDRDAVLVVDGSFLQRPEVARQWDFVILLTASREVSAARQVVRDGAPADAADPYHARYFGGYDEYVAALAPESGADVVIDNGDLEAPVMVSQGRSANLSRGTARRAGR